MNVLPEGLATALTFALTENWAGLVQWCRRDPSLTSDLAVYPLYLRALGETDWSTTLSSTSTRIPPGPKRPGC